MIYVTDEVVEFPNRYTLTNINNGTVLGTYDLQRTCGSIISSGTDINKSLLMALQGFVSQETHISLDGNTITEICGTNQRVTIFNNDGSITETLTTNGNGSITKTTSFLNDGTIKEVIVYNELERSN